jgi:phosphotransferase system HPr-like phosphotransfer protein
MVTRSVRYRIDTIEKVKAFVNCNATFRGSVSVVSGRYVIDGKSIMGMFSLDLTQELQIDIEAESDEAIDLLINDWISNGI